MIPYEIIATGSSGNAVVINHAIMVDCGVPYKSVAHVIGGVKLILLTHIHGDHCKASTLCRIAEERPLMRFGCGRWMAKPLIDAGVRPSQIDILDAGTMYGYGICNVIPVGLFHDVPNYGYKLHFPGGKVFYATDTGHLAGISARQYDLFLVEANHTEEEIQRKIAEKKAAGEYAYEIRSARYHLSKEKCDDFIYRNMKPRSEYAYLHCHEDEEVE